MSEPVKNKTISHYILYPIYNEDNFISNASVGVCISCERIATGMGGSDKDICIKCAESFLSKK